MPDGSNTSEGACLDPAPLILVVDDDQAVRALASAMLAARGHRVRTAADGIEALAMIREEHPALVFLDLHMPRASGFDVVRALRADPRTAHVRVIAMTTMPLDLVAPHEARLGCAVLSKELVLPRMTRIVEEHLARAAVVA